jgi:nicotinate-nucleotide adenylyltransferase
MTITRIGILGGTFDPVHFGHLRPALDVAEQLNLDHIRLIPCSVPPHRTQPQATAQQRLTMLQLAIKNNPRFIVDDCELQREGPSYTVDTLKTLRDEFPDTALYLILGTDAFLGLQSWHQWSQIIELAHIVVMQRPDEKLDIPEEFKQWYQQHLAKENNQTELAGSIWPVNVMQLAISATFIRQQITTGASPQFLLPDSVISLIEMLGLYQQQDE